MMPVGNLLKMVLANTVRSKRHFILSAFGIIIGSCAFTSSIALTQQAGAVLESVFPIEEVEIVTPRVSTFGKDTSMRLDDKVVKTLLARPEVKSAVPRMNLAFPAAGRGSFEGSDLKFEVGGFADGVDPSFVVDPSVVPKDDQMAATAHARLQELFKDWDAEKSDPNRVACVPPHQDPDDDIMHSPRAAPQKKKDDEDQGWGASVPDAGVPAVVDAGSADTGSASGSAGSGSGSGSDSAGSGSDDGSAGSGSGSAAKSGRGGKKKDKDKKEGPTYFNPCPNPDRYYCDEYEKICKHRVPIVLSSTVVELYNNQFAKTHGMPMADKDLVNFLIQNRGLSAMRFSIGLGFTTVAGTGKITRARPRRVEAVVIGVSPRAMRIGVTMPIQYIERWNKDFMGAEAAGSYSSIIATLRDRNQLAPFAEWLKGESLRLEDNLGEKFATVIFVIRLLFLIISTLILLIAVINIGHNFFVQVSERRREIGIMRAVGASQTDVMLVILGEAAIIGLIGGLVGVGLALGIGAGWDAYAVNGIPAFPHKPASWFDFKPWIWGSALGFSTLFCILGGFLPARRAAKMEPAQALAQN
jgi:FtsX-like permease family